MKKLTSIFLIFVLFASVVWASVPQKMRNDIVQMGIDGSTALKEFVFDVGDGAANPKITVDPAVKEFNMTKTLNVTGDVDASGNAIFGGTASFVGDTLTLGDGTNTNKTQTFDIGSGGSNPYIGWDSTQNALVFTNDGSLIKKIGTGGAGGDGGINILLNPLAEDGLVNWTNVGAGSFTEVTNSERLEGEKSFEFDSINIEDRVYSDLVTLNDGLIGVSCEARIYYNGGDENLILEVLNGNGTVIASEQLKTHVQAGFESAFFLCPTATEIAGDANKGDLRFQVRQSTGTNAAKIVFDRNHLGSLVGLVEMTLPDMYSARTDQSQPFGSRIVSSNTDWIENMTRSAPGQYNINIKAGVFTEVPACTTQPGSGNPLTPCAAWITNTTDIQVLCRDQENANVYVDRKFDIVCQAQGADAKQQVQVYKSIPKVAQNTNVFTAIITSGGTISTQSPTNWLTSCSNGASGTNTCNLVAGLVGFTPNMLATSFDGNRSISFSSVGTTSFTTQTTDGTGNYVNAAYFVTLQKRSDDYKTPIVQPILVNQVETMYNKGYKVGACMIGMGGGVPSFGNGHCTSWIDSLTDDGVGHVTLNLSSEFSDGFPNCACNVWEGGITARDCTITSLTSTSVRFLVTGGGDGSAAIDRNFSVVCIGDR